MHLPSVIHAIFGPFRARTPIDALSYRQMYDQSLADLSTATFPGERYEALTEMAAAADRLGTLIYVESLGATSSRDQQMRAESARWNNVRWLCLAIAATEHGLLLVDPSGHLTIVNDLADDFVALAEAADAEDPEKRARVLYAIAAYFTEDSEEPGDEYAGLTPFIDDIAATELSARRLTLTPEESTR
jgi:hypothetical protein